MKPSKTLIILSCFASIALFAVETSGSLESNAAPTPAGSASQEGNGDKLVYADFETAKDNRPVSARGGQVQLISYAERPTMPSRFKGMEGANPPAPEFARPNRESPNKAIAFDYDLQGTNQYAGVGDQIDGRPWEDGKPGADDVSGSKYLNMPLYRP